MALKQFTSGFFAATRLAAVVVGVAALCLVTKADGQAPALDTFLKGAQRLMGGVPGAESTETLPGLPAPAEPEAPDPRFTLPINRPISDDPIEVKAVDGLISLSVRDASLRQVLAALAQTQGLNLIIASPADAPVTAEFKKMPLKEVFASLLHSTGHSWTEHDGVIVVTSVTTGGGLSPDIQGRRVAVIELDFASAADLQPAVEGLLSAVGQSHYIETNTDDNRRTKELLIVEDLEPYLARIERYVSEADQAPRQVLIEVNLLQVNLDDDQRCGINFEAIGQLAGAGLSVGTQGLTGALPGSLTTAATAGGTGATALPGISGSSKLTGTPWASSAPGFFIQSSGSGLDAVIEALISTTDAKSLAAPRILAVNGQESHIQVGTNIGYQTTTTAVNGTTSGNVQYLETGIVLRVTPRITRDGRVLLKVEPEVSTGAINSETNAPDKQTTELRTNALLNSGQGIIIGGLIEEFDSTQVSRVPVLGSLPYINPLFQRRSVVKQRRELIVALVPHILPLSPELECRNQEELARAREPLVTGPLCRNPRPYEARLYDPYVDEKRFHVFDRHDPFCNASNGGVCSTCNENTSVTPEGVEVAIPELAPEPDSTDGLVIPLVKIRRLPAVRGTSPTSVATRPDGAVVR